ncbi:type IV pilus biogenesis protein PilM [Cohnella faecalis]|uniref:Pilus assembly protein PilM n=1 Tax=Cohnella faecalis TaxID=2315694 RepID=A0A398CJJ9_9BACL|nr:pilus assembly protein PilM [Cohnella faecalis]RIE01349.1 hypothetical protein D3H35_23540 [Cohnella faecalis]
MRIKQMFHQYFRRDCAGIEITDSCMKWVSLDNRRTETPVVHSYAIQPIEQGVIVDGVIVDKEAATRTLRALLARINNPTKRVHFVLPSQLVLTRILRLPDIPEPDLKKMVSFEIEHNLQLPFKHPYYDCIKLNGSANNRNQPSLKQLFSRKKPVQAGHIQIMGPAGAEAQNGMCDVLLAAAPYNRIEEYRNLFEECGLEPISFDIKSFSLFRLLQEDQSYDNEQTVMLADISANSADLVILQKGRIQISLNVPFQSSSQTDAAEDSFSQICAEFADEVDRLTKFYLYTLEHRGEDVATVYLTGDFGRMEDIREFLSRELPLEIRIVSNSRFSSQTPDFAPFFSALAVPLGLALRGSES